MTAGAAVREDVWFQSGAVRSCEDRRATWIDGLMTAPDAEPGYRALIPPGVRFEDEVLARCALRVAFYSPARELRRARCPLLVCVCEHDTVAPDRPTIRAAQRAPRPS